MPDLGIILRCALKDFEAEFFDSLEERGYAGFRPKHGALFVTIDLEGSRITDLARRAGLSKPAVLEVVDELERLGYVSRTQHGSDRRAKLIRPAPLFIRVLEDAAVIVADIERRYRRRIGKRQYESLRSALTHLAGAGATDMKRWGSLWHAGRAKASIPASAGPDIGVLLLLALQLFEREVFRSLGYAGYEFDRRKHLMVLDAVAENSRATLVAGRIGVSKPAVGKVIEDLEKRGYIRREEDPDDRRAKRVVLTPHGVRFLRDSKRVFGDVERRLQRPAQSKVVRQALKAMTSVRVTTMASGRKRPHRKP